MKKTYLFIKNWFFGITNFKKMVYLSLAMFGMFSLIQSVVEKYNDETAIVGIIAYLSIASMMLTIYGLQEGWHLTVKEKKEELETKLQELKDKLK